MPDAVDGPAAAVADDIAGLLSGTERVLVGITGPPGGGKTTITRAVIDILGARRGPDTVAYVPMDGFHLSDRVLADIGRGDRKGAPDTFDADGFVTLLERITACGDRPVYCPDFDHVMGEPIAARLVVAPTARVIVVEGNYFALDNPPWSAVRPLLRRLYYVDAPGPLRRERLLRRHRAAGKGLADAAAWVDSVDEPNALLVAASRHRADLVVDGQANHTED